MEGGTVTNRVAPLFSPEKGVKSGQTPTPTPKQKRLMRQVYQARVYSGSLKNTARSTHLQETHG